MCNLLIAASFTAKMKFIVKDCDPLTGEVQDDGYQEDYRVCIVITNNTITRKPNSLSLVIIRLRILKILELLTYIMILKSNIM